MQYVKQNFIIRLRLFIHNYLVARLKIIVYLSVPWKKKGWASLIYYVGNEPCLISLCLLVIFLSIVLIIIRTTQSIEFDALGQ